MNKREKYIKASENITLGKNLVCCGALSKVGLQAYEFHKIFKPRYSHTTNPYFGNHTNRKNQLARSLALLFMAELDK